MTRVLVTGSISDKSFSPIALRFATLSPDATILVDDIDWSNAFFAFCVQHRVYPLLVTDNGKDNLRVRTGAVRCRHSRNGNDLYT